jgi:uncharacterized protein with GYD domain
MPRQALRTPAAQAWRLAIMATYVILSRLSIESTKELKGLKQLTETVSQQARQQCPNVKWKQSFALMGRFDVLDVVEADSPADVEKAAMMIRTYGRAVTETMPARPWNEFVASL